MGKSVWFGGLVALLAAVAPRAVSACGGGGVTASKAGVVQDTQRIVIATHASTTDIIVQIGVPATRADYGALIPVPDEPTLDSTPVATEDLERLDWNTAPTLETQAGPGGSGTGFGCACGATDKAGGATKSSPVRASKPVEIGPVEAVTLSADDASAVTAWLADNGFALTSDDQRVVANYAGPGRYFIAIRRAAGSPTGADPSSIGLHYSLPGDYRTLSLGFARLGAAPIVAFTVFVATPEPAGPGAPFTPLTLSDLDAVVVYGAYTQAVATAVRNHGSQAFVVEGRYQVDDLALDVGPSIASVLEPGNVLMRWTTAIDRSALDTDAVFDQVYDERVETTVVFPQAKPLAADRAGLGGLGLLLLGGGLRRGVRALTRATRAGTTRASRTPSRPA